jgi:hypothetical protein
VKTFARDLCAGLLNQKVIDAPQKVLQHWARLQNEGTAQLKLEANL